MSFLRNMKRAGLAAGAVLALGFGTSAYAQAEVLAYWNFNNPNDPSPPAFTFPLAADTGSGTLTSNFEATNVQSFGGSTVNALDGVPAGGDLALQGGTDTVNNGRFLKLQTSTVGKDNLTLTFSARRSGSGFNSVLVEVSPDDASYTAVTTLTDSNIGGSHALQSVTLPASAENLGSLYVRLTMDGATGSTGNVRIDNLTVLSTPEGTPAEPVYTAISVAPNQIEVDFTVAPTVAVTASDWDLTDSSGVSVTSVADLGGDSYLLTLSGPASGDLEVDNLFFFNGVDEFASVEFRAGIISPETLRTAILADPNFNPLLGFVPGTVGGVVVENRLDTRAFAFADGAYGFYAFNSGGGLAAQVEIGDEVLVYGPIGQFRGLNQISPATLLSATPGGTLPPVNVVDVLTATAADFEQVESTIVRYENLEFVDAGTEPGCSANQPLVGISLLEVRFSTAICPNFSLGEPGAFILPSGSGAVTGLASQFTNPNENPRDNGYQVQPRTLADFDFAASVNDWMMFR